MEPAVAARPELSVADLCALTDLPAWRIRRDVARWAKRGYPRVRREPCRGDSRGRLLVDKAEWEAVFAGELSEAPLAA